VALERSCLHHMLQVVDLAPLPLHVAGLHLALFFLAAYSTGRGLPICPKNIFAVEPQG